MDSSINGLIFELKENFYQVKIDYKTNLTNIFIPSIYNGIQVKNIVHTYESKKQNSIEEIVIENGIENIEYCAFENCSKLIKIILPNTLKTLSESAFNKCLQLNYNIYKNGKYLGNNENPYLVLVDIIDKKEPFFTVNDNTKIINDIFKNYNALSEIKLNNCVEYLYCSFINLPNLTSLVVPASVKYIQSHFISSCNNFEELIFEENNENNELTIKYGLLNNLNKISKLVLPKRLSIIPRDFIISCKNLSTLDFQENSNVKKIEDEIFQWTYKIKNILNIPEHCDISSNAFIRTWYYSINKNRNIDHIKIINEDIIAYKNIDSFKINKKINENRIVLSPLIDDQHFSTIILNNELENVEEIILLDGFIDIEIEPGTRLKARYLEFPNGFNETFRLSEEFINAFPNLEIIYTHSPIYPYRASNANFVICYPQNTTLIWDDDEFNPDLKKWISYSPKVKHDEIYYKNGIYYQIKKKEVTVLKVNYNLEEVNFEDYILGKPITRIGNGAFKGYKGTKVTLPNTLVSIGDRAFRNVNLLDYLILPENLSLIESKAFLETYNLKILAIGPKKKSYSKSRWNPEKCFIKFFDTVEAANEYILKNPISHVNANNDYLFSITIIKKYYEKHYLDFYNDGTISSFTSDVGYIEYCTTLIDKYNDKKIIVPFIVKGVKSKNVHLDKNFVDIEELTLENGIENISCDENLDFNLKKLFLPITFDSENILSFCQKYFKNLEVLYVDSRNFRQYKKIEKCSFDLYLSYKVSKPLKTYDDLPLDNFIMIHYNSNMNIAKKTDIVKNCELDRVLPSNNVVSKSKNNFIEIDNVQYIIKNNCATVSRYVGDEEELIIPSSIEINGNQYTVASIGKSAFKRCSLLKRIMLPKSIVSICESAFEDCSSLKSIKIPNSVTSIGFSAFCGCSSLKSIKIPSSVTKIEEKIFSDYSLVHRRDCDPAIYCELLSKPNRWNKYWNSVHPVYWGINENNYIEIDQVQYIVRNNCAIVTKYVGDEEELIIPSSIKINGNQYTVASIGKSAFANCNYLKIIKLPNTILSIGEKVFSNCNNLIKVYFNESIKKWKRITKKINSFGYYNPSLKLIALNDTILINGDVIDDEEIL